MMGKRLTEVRNKIMNDVFSELEPEEALSAYEIATRLDPDRPTRYGTLYYPLRLLVKNGSLVISEVPQIVELTDGREIEVSTFHKPIETEKV